MSNRNPYAAPQANVALNESGVDEYGEVRVFSVSGRIGRVRYLAYSIGLSLLVFLGLGIIAAIAAAVMGDPSVAIVVVALGYFAAILIQFLPAIQRSHDMNVTGWLSLIVLVPFGTLVFLFAPGTRGENNYGLRPPPNGVGVILVACLLPLFFVGGILAAIAIPAYQDYTIRAQVSEGLNLAAVAKVAVAEAYERTRAAPADRREAGLPADPTATSGLYVTSVDVDHGTILVTYGGNANSMIAGTLLALQPYVAEGNVVWRCGHAPEPPGAAEMDAGATSSAAITNIEARYLPSLCRP
jgi:uncharacterized membrane protein YhaH (DUF805 family)/Tfp pilus assembly major pilin PilA